MATVTQLRTFGPVLAKRWHRGSDGALIVDGYDDAKHFAVTVHEVLSLADLARVLDAIARDPRSCIIRGRPNPKTGLARARRRKIEFHDAGQSWSPHDFDSIDCPPWLDWRAEPAAAAAYLRSLLPPEFHEAACWWSFTGSQGFKPGLNMRLAFFHDLPLTCADLKRWLGERQPTAGKPTTQWPKLYPVDLQLYGAVQPVYVAAPVLGPGVADPVPVRSGILPGRFDEVPTPWPIVPRYGSAAVQVATVRAAALPQEHAGRGYFYHRGCLGDGEALGGFHRPLRTAVAAWFAQHGANADATQMLADLASAAWAAPRRPGEDRRAEVADRVAALPRVVEWVREQQRASERRHDAIGAPCAAPAAVPTLSLAEAEQALRAAMSRTFADCRRFFHWRELFYDPPCVGIGAGIGIGKTAAAVDELVRLVSERPGMRIAFAVPTHRTGDDITARLNAAAGNRIAATWRGIEQPDPARPGCSMCRVPLLAARVRAAGGGVRDVCGGPRRGWCRHNPGRPGIAAGDACGYRQQSDADVSVWVVPHAMLAAAPSRGLPAFDMLVIDEAPWLSLFGGFDPNAPVRVPLAELLRVREVDGTEGAGTLLYASAAGRLRQALAGQDGLLRRANLVGAGLGAYAARRCAADVWRTAKKPTIDRELPEAEAVAAFSARVGQSGLVHLVARAWRLIADFLDSGEAVAPETLRIELDAPNGPALRLRWRNDIHHDWLAGPVLYLDATLNPVVAPLWLPRIEIAATVQAAETAVHRIQVFDRQNGKTGLVGKLDGRAERMQHHRIRRMRRQIEALAFTYRGLGAAGGPDVLIVTYKALVPQLKRGIPPNVAFSHFGAARGFDGWRGVRVVVVIGRPLPAQRDVAVMAAVAAGRLGNAFGSDYERAKPGALLMRDGSGRRVLATEHPDHFADAFRRQVLTEVEQSEGRARGVRRTSGDPLLSMLLTAHPTLLAIDEAVEQDAILDGVGVIAHLAARGVVPGNYDDAAKVLADDFDGEGDPAAALRKRMSDAGFSGALARVVGGTGPLSSERVSNVYIAPITQNSHIRGSGAEPAPESFRSFRAYRYRRADRRKSSVALIDVQRHPDPRAALAAMVGELAVFERVAAPAWLADVRAELTYSLPEQVFPLVPSAFTAILGTDHRAASTAPQLLPVAEDILSVQRRGQRVSVHSYGAPHGVPLVLIRTADAAWPPRRKPPAGRAISAEDVAAAVGVSWPKVRDLLTDIHAQERADAVGFERAAVEVLQRHVGAERVGAAVADLKRRSGA